MIGWFRQYFADEDIWFHYEVDHEGWVCRQADLRGADLRPVTAASLAEVTRARELGGADAVIAYETIFGILSEGCEPDGWHDQSDVEEISAEEFERVWAAAREVLEERSRR